jgi:hypothetical protein
MCLRHTVPAVVSDYYLVVQSRELGGHSLCYSQAVIARLVNIRAWTPGMLCAARFPPTARHLDQLLPRGQTSVRRGAYTYEAPLEVASDPELWLRASNPAEHATRTTHASPP